MDVVQPGFFNRTVGDKTPRPRAGVVMAGNVLWDMWGKCSTPAVPMSGPWFSRQDGNGNGKWMKLEEQPRASNRDIREIHLFEPNPYVWITESTVKVADCCWLRSIAQFWNVETV